MNAVTFHYPPTANKYYRSTNKGVLISKKGREYRNSVAVTVMTNRAAKRLTGPLKMYVAVYPPDKRKRDIDNICKPLLDALEKAGVYENDSQIEDLHLVRKDVIRGGKVVVTISH